MSDIVVLNKAVSSSGGAGGVGNVSAFEFAILYLDNLEILICENRTAFNELTRAAKIGLRPFITLRYRNRGGRMCWSPQETNYLSNI
jgi:hypothetical protein